MTDTVDTLYMVFLLSLQPVVTDIDLLVAGHTVEILQPQTLEPVSYAETRPSVLWTGKTKCGQVFICLDGWTKKKKINSYLSRSTARRTAQSALHVMLLSYYLGSVYFTSINATFAVAARTRMVSQWPCTCPTTGNILILHKPLAGTERCPKNTPPRHQCKTRIDF